MEGLNGVIAVALSIFLLTGFCEGILFLKNLQPPYPPSAINSYSISGSPKLEIQNVTFEKLTKNELEYVGHDLTYLKISNSEIGEIDKFAFDRLKHLNFLDLSNNRLKSEIHPDTFSRLPGLEILVLKNLGAKSLNLNLTNVQELILSENELEEIGEFSIEGNHINYIDVSSNHLQNLSQSFEGLYKLSMIDLSKNQIINIEKNIFENNVNLLRILASKNKITSTRGLALVWLRTLDLFMNEIETLDEEAFRGMSSLEELVLAFNKIKNIEDCFKDLTSIKFLNLAWNRIENLRPDLFRQNTYLTKLELQGNKLKTLTQFQGDFHHLNYLDLSHNELSAIEQNFFKSMRNINYLDLSFNRLSTVSVLFKPLEKVSVLLLSFNRIVLSGEEFTENRLLAHLNLSSNGLELGVSFFKNLLYLKSVDLSQNKINNFCDANVTLNNVMKMSLRENEIKRLSCLRLKQFKSLCALDISNNPLTCGWELDQLMYFWATNGLLPMTTHEKIHSDIFYLQCPVLPPLDETFKIWNEIKRDFCPYGENINRIKYVMNELNESIIVASEKPQSERKSWDDIEEIPEIVSELNYEEKKEEAEEEEEEETEMSLLLKTIGWYLLLGIVICGTVILIFLRLGSYFMLCHRLRNWGKFYLVTPKSYVVLSNEVYKRTTEPSPPQAKASWIDEQLMNVPTKNNSEGKMRNYFYNFGYCKKGKNMDCDKNILINS